MPKVELHELVRILQTQGEMISALARDILTLDSDLKRLAGIVEQQGRFMADLSVRLEHTEQLMKLLQTPDEAMHA